MVWNNFAFISLVCALLSTASAVLCLSAKRQGGSILFGLICTLLALWSFSLFVGMSTNEPSQALFWARCANSVVLFLPVLLFHFVVSFVGKQHAYERVSFSYYLLSLLYLSLIFIAPEHFLHSPSFRFDAFWFPVGGNLFYPFPVFFAGIIGHTLYVLLQERAETTRSGKLKLDYLIMTIALGFLGGGMTLSLEFDINIPPYGLLSVALMVVISTYAVLKHDLLELPETLSFVITRLMIYICIVGFVVLMLKGGIFIDQAYLSVSQTVFLVLITICSCEFYAAMKSRLQAFSDKVLVRQKLDAERHFRDLMYQLDQSDDFESMLPILRQFFEQQSYIHHYAWYLDRVLLERTLSRKELERFDANDLSAERNYQRILFSGSDGRRHDRLPSSINVHLQGEAEERTLNAQMVEIMSTEQLDAAYDWVEMVPGREMLGLPVVANSDFRGMLLVVVSKSDMRLKDQSRLQALSSKLGRLIERVEFFRRQAFQEQRFLFQKMQSLQSLAGNIANDMRGPLDQLHAFVEHAALVRAELKDERYLDSPYSQAHVAIARSAQVIDMSLGLVKDEPIDVSTFKVLSIQSVVTKSLAEYVFMPGERERIRTDLRQDFLFKGDEWLLIYALFNILKTAINHSVVAKGEEITIDSRVEGGRNVLLLRYKEGVQRSQLEGLRVVDEDSSNLDLATVYYRRVMSALGGAISYSSDSEQCTEILLVFPCLRTGGGDSESILDELSVAP